VIERGVLNWQLNLSSTESWVEHSPELAAAITVHALYTMPEPLDAIQQISKKLKLGGVWLFAI
jgi:hypothetical protein